MAGLAGTKGRLNETDRALIIRLKATRAGGASLMELACGMSACIWTCCGGPRSCQLDLVALDLLTAGTHDVVIWIWCIRRGRGVRVRARVRVREQY